VFQDFGLSILHPWPLRTDSVGRVPAFWLDDGQYRARFTDAAGAVVYFDIPSIQAVGPSTGDEGGGGGDSVDPTAIFQTGDELFIKRSGTRTGWVRQNARTIGSASSGATERANADTQPLYEYLWNTFSDTLCPVTGGRGGTASADFAANKAIATPDMRGYGPLGLDDMGNSAASRITDGTPTAAGSSGGAEKATFSIARNNLPNVDIDIDIDEHGGHDHDTPARTGGAFAGSSTANVWNNVTTGKTSKAETGITASFNLNGDVEQVALTPNVMSPYRLGTWYIKL
jgi:hypothetical protein